MLTEEQKAHIIAEIKIKLNRPILNSFIGKFALKMVVNEVDVVLSKTLPPEIYTVLSSASDGLTPEETALLKDVLPKYILSQVHNPILNSILDGVIDAFIDVLIPALNMGQTLPTATPEVHVATDAGVAATPVN